MAAATATAGRLFLVVLVASALTACTTAPRDINLMADYKIGQAEKRLSEGKVGDALSELMIALNYPAGPEKVRAFFAAAPDRAQRTMTQYELWIRGASRPSELAFLRERLTTLSAANALPSRGADVLINRLDATGREANRTGVMEFTLDDVAKLPFLAEAEQVGPVFERTLQVLQASSDSRPMSSLMTYLSGLPATSPQRARVEGLLPKLNVKKSELPAVAPVFSAFAQQRAAELTFAFGLEVKGADRLHVDDLFSAVTTQIKAAEWKRPGPTELPRVVVERIRYDERQSPTRTESVTYAQHEVNIVDAVLLMPRGASYSYEVAVGGAEIDYGYSVAFFKGGTMVQEEVVRGRVGGEWRRCSNARITNVFGGVSSASFTANDDMRRRCSGPEQYPIDNLRTRVIDEVVEAIKKLPEVARAIRLN